MNSAQIVGQTIAKIVRERATDSSGHPYWNVVSIELENGARIWPVTVEQDDGYGHEFGYAGPRGAGTAGRVEWFEIENEGHRVEEATCNGYSLRVQADVGSNYVSWAVWTGSGPTDRILRCKALLFSDGDAFDRARRAAVANARRRKPGPLASREEVNRG